MADLSTITLPSGDTYNLKDQNAVPSSEKAAANGVATLDANGLIPQSQVPGMVILSYGNNTWDDFLAAYQKNNVIYCRASSNSNPASGSQTRLAFMAYVNNATSPTEVEFQYYRSVSSHNATQQGDQVYVYKLNKNNGWSVTVREAYTRVVTNNGLASTWSGGVLTAHADILSTTKLSNAATAATEVAGRVYPVALDTNGKLAVNVPWEVPTAVSELTNDSGYQTSAQVDTAISAEAGKLIPYGYCETAADVIAKTVTVSPSITELVTGLTILVKFQYANRATDPTLNVNNLGAIAIKRYGTTAAGTSAAASWNAGAIVTIIYDGTNWILNDWNNATYSGMSVSEYQAGTSTTNRLISPQNLKNAILYHAGGSGAVRYDEAQSLTDAQKSQARSNIEASGMIESTITAKNSLTIPNGTSGQPLTSLNLVLGANQDFNGYGEMWSWGESKNLLTTIQDGSDGNVTWQSQPDGSVAMYGTGFAYGSFGFRSVTLAPGEYIFSGYPSEYSSQGELRVLLNGIQTIGADAGAGCSFTLTTQSQVFINFYMKSNTSLEGIILYPMICSADDPDPYTYVPYCNMSPFDGRTSANIEAHGGASTDYHNYAVALGQTVYGATLDVTSGEMTVTHGFADINDFAQDPVQQTQGGQYVWEASLGDMDDGTAVCSMLHQLSIADAMLATNPCFFVDNGSICVCAKDSTWAKFSARYKFLQFTYPLASPTTSQVTPTQVTLFDGENQLMVDDCDITVGIKEDAADYAVALEERVDALETNTATRQYVDNILTYGGIPRVIGTPLNITLTSAGWTSNTLDSETYYTQTVSATGLDSSMKLFGFLNLTVPQTASQLLANRAASEAYGLISDFIISGNSIIAYAYGDCPTVDLSINLIGVVIGGS